MRYLAHIALIGALSFTAAACSDGSAASINYDPVLEASARQEAPSVVSTLEALVNIETGTYNPDGIPRMGEYLEGRLKSLGASVERVTPADGTVGFNVVGRLQGGGTKRILMMAHMDTVYPVGALAEAPFRIEGDRAYGPGIADAKGGVATILHALELLRQKNFSNYGVITVLFNTDEEKGSFGSRDLIQQLAAESDYVMSYEPGTTLLTSGTSGIAYVDAVVHGRSSHAGVAPQAGINALVVASDYVLRTRDIQDLSQEKAFNWTILNSGEVSNTIPDLATLRGDMRYGRNEDMEVMSQQLLERAEHTLIEGSSIEVTITRGRPAFNLSEEGRRVANHAVDIMQDLGIQAAISDNRVGAGSDAAYAALSGKPVVEGFGLAGGSVHSRPGLEFVDIESIPQRLYLSAQMIVDLSNGI